MNQTIKRILIKLTHINSVELDVYFKDGTVLSDCFNYDTFFSNIIIDRVKMLLENNKHYFKELRQNQIKREILEERNK